MRFLMKHFDQDPKLPRTTKNGQNIIGLEFSFGSWDFVFITTADERDSRTPGKFNLPQSLAENLTFGANFHLLKLNFPSCNLFDRERVWISDEFR